MCLWMRQPGLAVARYGLEDCSTIPRLHHRPASPSPPPSPAPFPAGNETSSNYSSQARKSGRSHGPHLTQLRSAMSGRPTHSPLPLMFICPEENSKVTNFASSELYQGEKENGVPGSRKIREKGSAGTGKPGPRVQGGFGCIA